MLRLVIMSRRTALPSGSGSTGSMNSGSDSYGASSRWILLPPHCNPTVSADLSLVESSVSSEALSEVDSMLTKNRDQMTKAHVEVICTNCCSSANEKDMQLSVLVPQRLTQFRSQWAIPSKLPLL